MASVVRNFVEGIGVTPFRELPNLISFFRETVISEVMELPMGKPNMGQLLSVAVTVDIVSQKFVKTSTATSFEGQQLSGNKLVLELKLNKKIKYAADTPNQSVHGVCFENISDSTYIVLPEEYDGLSMKDLFDYKMLIVTPYIVDIYSAKLDHRKLMTNTLLLVNAEPNIRTA